MNWLNLEIKNITSHEFLGSEPIDRATWICLLRYCAQRENGGIIEGCGAWGDRKWMQLIGVTSAEVSKESQLWSWDGHSLTVWCYPTTQENKFKTNRVNGLKGGRPITQNKPCGYVSYNPNVTREHNVIGIERERVIEKEIYIRKKFIIPKVEEVREYSKTAFPELDAEAFVAYYNSNGWMVGKSKMKDWHSAVITWKKNYRKPNQSGFSVGQKYFEEGVSPI
jgi:hypothetical protein